MPADPKPIPAIKQEDIARFWSLVDKRGPDECWLWKGTISAGKYGRLALGKHGSYIATHRLAYFLGHGEDPFPINVLHRCDNPPCCNYTHLFKGTRGDNNRDRKAKGRGATGDRSGPRTHPERYPRGNNHPARIDPSYLARGEAHGNSKLTADQVTEIRGRYVKQYGALAALAREFGVHHSVIMAVVKRETWKHVP